MIKLVITINDEIKVCGNNRELLINQLENAGFRAESHCRDGLCGACRCVLLSGNVIQKDHLAQINNNEILACCAIPKGNIDIKFPYKLNIKKT